MSRKNDHWQWQDVYQIEDNDLTRFSVPLRLKPLVQRSRNKGAQLTPLTVEISRSI